MHLVLSSFWNLPGLFQEYFTWYSVELDGRLLEYHIPGVDCGLHSVGRFTNLPIYRLKTAVLTVPVSSTMTTSSSSMRTSSNDPTGGNVASTGAAASAALAAVAELLAERVGQLILQKKKAPSHTQHVRTTGHLISASCMHSERTEREPRERERGELCACFFCTIVS